MGALPRDPPPSSPTAQLITLLLDKPPLLPILGMAPAPGSSGNISSQKELPKGVTLVNSLLEPPGNQQQARTDVRRTSICWKIQCLKSPEALAGADEASCVS